MTNAAWVPTMPVSPDTEELRLAVTMTGGVSLAVWMGGTAREIDLLMQASVLRRQLPLDVAPAAAQPAERPAPVGQGVLSAAEVRQRDLYGRLLELLDVVAEVDVLSGTSAGGINAILLAYARVHRGDLGRARTMWLDLGSMLDLLRDPKDSELPSLLYGDAWLYKQLAESLPQLAPQRDAPLPLPSTTLYVTTTLLAGESARFTDALGTPIHDNTRRGLFTFAESDLAEKGIEGVLAVAGRSTASFPAAFEPSYLPRVQRLPGKGDVPERPAVGKYANITADHWAADGGLLDNQPLDVLLDRIFDRRARRRVRRVLLFVVPSTSPAKDAPLADVADPLGLLDGLLKDLSAVTGQSISSSLQAIVRHNDGINARTELRTNLADLATDKASRLLTDRLLGDYCAAESERHARQLVDALLRVVSLTPPGPSSAGVQPQSWLTVISESDAETRCRAAVRDVLAAAWQPSNVDALPEESKEFVRFGQTTYDNAKSLALQLLGLAYEAANDGTERRSVITAITSVHGAAPKAARPDASALVEPVAQETTLPSDSSAAVALLVEKSRKVASSWLEAAEVEPDVWDNLAAALFGARDVLVTTASRDDEVAVAVRYLGLDAASPDATSVVRKLFDLAVTESALLPVGTGPFQPVKLVQMSADSQSLLAPGFATAEGKLTGMQFHHFGAFYKRSWRANDWMWGRLDGCTRLVQLLLDPARLRQIASNQAAPRGRWLLGELEKLGLVVLRETPTDEPDSSQLSAVGQVPTRNMLLSELGFLDDPEAALPQSLPLTAGWLATAWQKVVTEDELPKLAREVVGSPDEKADWSPAASRTWAAKVLEPNADLAAQLEVCPVPKETFASDVGSQLMVHTLAKAAATTSGVLATVGQLPRQVRPALTTVRTVALGGYRLSNATGSRPRNMVLAGGVALALGSLLSIQSSGLLGVPGITMAAVGGYVLAFGVWQLSRMLLTALVGTTAIVAILVLMSSWCRTRLFGARGKAGWIGQHAYVLGEKAWYPPALIVGLVVIGAVVSGALSWAAPTRRRSAPVPKGRRR